jgi:hypothetical protein
MGSGLMAATIIINSSAIHKISDPYTEYYYYNVVHYHASLRALGTAVATSVLCHGSGRIPTPPTKTTHSFDKINKKKHTRLADNRPVN